MIRPKSQRLQRFEKKKSLEGQLTADRLNQIVDGINARTPRPGARGDFIWDSGGFSYSSSKKGRGGGGASLALPLTVGVSKNEQDEYEYTVSFGVAYFENVEYIPTIDGVPLNTSPAPIGSWTPSSEIILNWTGTLETQQSLFFEDDQTSYLVTHFGPSPQATVFNGVTVEAEASPSSNDKRPTPNDPTFDQYGTLATAYDNANGIGADQANWGSCWITAQSFVTRVDYNGTPFYESASVGVTSWGAIEVTAA